MGAVEFSKALATFLHGRQGVDGPDEFGHAKSPKKPPTRKDRATKRGSGRSLLTQGDIQAAVRWGLAGTSAGLIDDIARALEPLAGDLCEDRHEVAAVLRDLCSTEGRSAWLIACAALARDAERRGDVHAFASAVVELVDAMRQSERRSGKLGPVAQAIQDTKACHPGIGAEAAIAMLIDTGQADYVSLSDDLLIGGKRIQLDSFIRTFRRT